MSTTQLHFAAAGITTQAMKSVAEAERLSEDFIREEVRSGRLVIPSNIRHGNLNPIGVGRALRVKVNANIGNSALAGNEDGETSKLRCALDAGADTVMDLSTGPEATRIRRRLLAECTAPFGTVPIYGAVAECGDATALTPESIIDVILRHAKEGVDFMTIHAGILRRHTELAERRLIGIVSRGGAILAKWMHVHRRENPLYERFDQILEIASAFDVTISLGDGLRPGCLADASDAAQFAELETLGELVRRCRAAGVQCMVEGPGHIPLDEVEMNMKKADQICDGAPLYILGPVVCDCAPGYDHISAAIGGALGAMHGAALLCYVTPREHLGLPTLNDVRTGVVAFKLAAHAANVALKRPGARDRDDEISRARRKFDWNQQFELALDPATARAMREEVTPPDVCATDRFCTMCGKDFCSMRMDFQ